MPDLNDKSIDSKNAIYKKHIENGEMIIKPKLNYYNIVKKVIINLLTATILVVGILSLMYFYQNYPIIILFLMMFLTFILLVLIKLRS